MGSYAYDFLNESFLLNKNNIKNQYKNISDALLEKEVITYREYCLQIFTHIKEDILSSKNVTRSLASEQLSTIPKLKQAALYLEEIIIEDPIFALSNINHKPTDVIKKFMGNYDIEKINRFNLSNAAQKLIDLQPLVAGGYVKIYPYSFELEPEVNTPLWFSNTGFTDILPPKILDFYQEKAIVKSVQNNDGTFLVMNDLYPCDQIHINFQSMEHGFSMGHLLTTSTFTPTDKENVYKVIQKRLDAMPTLEHFQKWVQESINRTAISHYEQLYKRLSICNNLDSMFVTEHQFEHFLLNENFHHQDIPSNTLNCTMKMDVPFIDSISSENLMLIRNDYGSAFQSFRKELEKGLRAVRYETNIDKINMIIEDTQHELFEVQMTQIEPQIKQLRNTHTLEAIIAIAGIGVSIATSGSSLIATLLAGLNAIKSQTDFKSKIAANPSHFLWEVKKHSKK